MSEEIAQAAGDIAYWRRRAEQAEAKVNGLNLAADQYSESRDQWMLKAKATQADAAALRGVLLDLVNQLTLLTRDDMTYLWRIGGRPLDDAFLAAKRTLDADHPGAALLAELDAARRVVHATRSMPNVLMSEALEAYDAVVKARK